MTPRSRWIAAGCTALALGAGVAALLLPSCSKETTVEPIKPADSSKYNVKPFVPAEAAGAKAPKVTFSDATKGSGLEFTHVTGAFGKKYLPETMGAGAALFDYDADGLLDVFLVQGAEWPGHETMKPAPTSKLYRNLGGMKFEDVTAKVGLDVAMLGMGAAAADYDADGDVDLFVTALGPYRLFRHDVEKPTNGGGPTHRFVEVSEPAGLITPTWTDKAGKTHPSWSTGAAWLDYDRDGALDLFVCHYVHWSVENDIYTTLGMGKAYTIPTKYDADSCRLWRGKGDGTFTDVTKAAGILRNDSKALGVAVAYVNGDAYPDIAVSNDTQPNFLFLSRGDGTFVEQANDAGMAYDESGRARAGMGIDAADLHDNGRMVVSIGNFSREPVSMYTQIGDQVFFVDRAGAARIATPTTLTLKFAILFCDYDLDGALDLLACNGHIEPDIAQVDKDIQYEQPTQLFWNRGDGTFADVSAECGEVLNRKVVGRGVAAGDLDGDGDLDLVMTQNGREALLIRNDQDLARGWLRVRLEGAGKNRDALGARVTLLTPDKKKQRRDVRTGSSYLSQCDVAPTFGLGSKTTGTEAVEVRWPTGKPEIEVFDNLEVNREHAIKQGTGKAR